MIAALLVIHVLVALVMVLAIMLQSGQAGGISGAFGGGGGGGGSQSLFGGRGASSFLSKGTAYLGAAFLVVSLVLAYAQAQRGGGAQTGRNIIQEAFPQQPTSGTAPVEGPPTEMPTEGGDSEGLLPPADAPPAAEPGGDTESGG